jgi:hypothetical protein
MLRHYLQEMRIQSGLMCRITELRKIINAQVLQVNLAQTYGAVVSLLAHLDIGTAPLSIKIPGILQGTLTAGQAAPSLPITLEVDENAAPGTYPIIVALTYKTLQSTLLKDGDTRLEWFSGSSNQELNIEIKERLVKFSVTAVEADLNPGLRKEIKVTINNIGSELAKDLVR